MKCLAFSFAHWVPVAFGADTAADLQEEFVGSWKLVSIEGPNQQPISGKPFGMIMYDNTGHMAVQIVRGERPAFPSPAKATDKERAQAYSTYTAYYGTYTFDPGNHIVIHHLELAGARPDRPGQHPLLRAEGESSDAQRRQRW